MFGGKDVRQGRDVAGFEEIERCWSLRTSDSTRPSRIRTTRRAHAAMSFSCVTMMMVLPARFSSVSKVMISSLVFESRLPVGSSARMT